MVIKTAKLDLPEQKDYSRELYRNFDHNIVVTLNGKGEIWFYLSDTDGDIIEERRLLKFEIIS